VTKTKHDLVELIYNTLQVYSKRDVISIVESFFEIMKKELENKHEIVLSGFGKFRVIKKAERMGRNPRTGESTIIKARHVVTFRPSLKLREKTNQ